MACPHQPDNDYCNDCEWEEYEREERRKILASQAKEAKALVQAARAGSQVSSPAEKPK